MKILNTKYNKEKYANNIGINAELVNDTSARNSDILDFMPTYKDYDEIDNKLSNNPKKKDIEILDYPTLKVVVKQDVIQMYDDDPKSVKSKIKGKSKKLKDKENSGHNSDVAS